MGVPEALIQQAMMQITQQTQPVPQEAGLAAMRIPQRRRSDTVMACALRKRSNLCLRLV